jgi:two-component system, response regulator PdtaR
MTAQRILIVEDDSFVALLLEYTLVKLGYSICGTEQTEDGCVATAIRCRPDAMVVDVGLAQGNGIQAVNRILCDRYVPHVFISGDRLEYAGLHPLAIRLHKPFRDVDLAASLSRLFSLGAS